MSSRPTSVRKANCSSRTRRTGKLVESLAFDTDEWAPRRIVIDAGADDTYYLGIKGPDARIRNAVLDRPDPVE